MGSLVPGSEFIGFWWIFDMSTPGVETATLRSSRPPAARGIRQRRPKQRPKKKAQCPECQSENIEESEGATVCGDCGTSINESNIVSEVQFGENASGAAVVQGAFVNEDQRHARGDPGRYGNIREPREVSEQHGREELRKQSSWHHLPEHIYEQAFAFYKLGLNINFVQGRMISVVAAVCLYAACRRSNNKDHGMLLIDFAEGIAINVYRIGQTWQDLKKALMLTECRPVMDVEDMVQRFVRKLEFGRDTHKVVNDTLLLLRRMKRDWMVTGRRPNGLIGACIILAARMNNYRRTVREVVYVTKVCDMTVVSRLKEFQRTEASTMTVEDFVNKGLRLKQSEPPAVYQAREREIRKRKIAEMLSEDVELSGHIPTLSDVVPLHRPVSESPRATQTQSPSTTPQPNLQRTSDGFAIPDKSIRANPNVDPALTGETNAVNQSKVPSQQRRNTSSEPPDDDDDNASEADSTRKVGRPKGSKRIEPRLPWTEDDLVSEDQLAQEMEQILEDPRNFGTVEDEIATITPEAEERSKLLAASLLRATSLAPAQTISNDPEVAAEEFEDDPEVANCLLSPDEQRIKEKIWVTHNEDWLRSQQAKMLKKTLDEAQGGGKPKEQDPNGKKKKRRAVKRMGDGSLLRGRSASSAADAVAAMLTAHTKNPSKHINYDHLNKVFRSSASRSTTEAPDSRAGSVAAGSRAGSVARPSVAPSGNGSSRHTPIEIGDEAGDSRYTPIEIGDEEERESPRTPTRIRHTVANAGLVTPDATQRTPIGSRARQNLPKSPSPEVIDGPPQAGPGAEEDAAEGDEGDGDGAEDDLQEPEADWNEEDDADEEEAEDEINEFVHGAGLEFDDESEVGFSGSEAGDD